MKINNTIARILCLVLLLLGYGAVQGQTFVCSGSPVVLTLSGYSGTIQWEYSASPSGPFTAMPGVVGDSAAITADSAGYIRAVVSSGTCDPFYSDTLELVVFPGLIADAGPDIDLCVGDSVMIGGSPIVSGGTPPYTYNWSPTTGLDNPIFPNPMAAPAATTTYTITVVDANGCVDTDDMTVFVNALPTVSAGSDSTITCGDSLVLNGSATGTGPVAYVWSPSGELSSGTVANPTATPTSNTTFVLTATDSLGCSASDSVAVIVNGASTGSDTLDYVGVIDTSFVIPACAGTITIEVWGAQGGSNTSSVAAGGSGSYERGEFSLAPGTRLKVLVGQYPGTASNGGGGGTFVTLTNNTPLIIAGGGGGSGAANDGTHKHGQTTTSGATGSGGGGLGGTNGSGGFIGASFAAGAGAGLLTDGQDGWVANSGGDAFVNGGAGANVGFGIGGFGGGGNGSGYVVGGGGGGYSGGGAASNSVGGGGFGGGGGSYNSGANPVSTGGVNLGNGRVVISW